MSERSSLASAVPVGSNGASIWSTLSERFPAWRNATRYYFNDVSKLSAGLYNTTVRNAAIARDDYEAEVHYEPHPPEEVGLQIRFYKLQNTAQGDTLLLLGFDLGFAVFKVLEDGVYEMFVDLAPREWGHTVGLLLRDTNEWIVVFSKAIIHYLPTSPKKESRIRLFDEQATVSAVEMHARSEFALLWVNDFSQIIVVNLNDFSDVTSLVGDCRAFSLADRWLAYSAVPEDHVPTSYSGGKESSTSETVAKNVLSGFNALKRGLLGTPPMNPQNDPLGAVIIHDLRASVPFAAFTAHNHALQCMSFDGSGTLLATASTVGTSVNVFRIATIVREGDSAPRGEVTLLFSLSRGVTSSTVADIAFSPLNFWVAVSTAVGTCHLFRVPDAERRGLRSATTAATVVATARVRSAPASTSPTPHLLFSPHMINRRPEEVGIGVVTASGSLAYVTCTEAGAHLAYGQHLPAFYGTRPMELHHSRDSDPDLIWRSALELTSHSIVPKAKHITFAIPAAEHETARDGAVDVCADWDTSA